MNVRHAAFLPAAICVALVTGCESARAVRIRENPALFASLDPFSKRLVQQGHFDLGFTPEVVTLALGKPNRIKTTQTPEGAVVETWFYRNYLYQVSTDITLTPRIAITGATNRPSPRAGTPAGRYDRPGQPDVVPDMSGAQFATLMIELRDGRVVAARLDPY